MVRRNDNLCPAVYSAACTFEHPLLVLQRGQFCISALVLRPCIYQVLKDSFLKVQTAIHPASPHCPKRGVAYPRLPYLRRDEPMLFDVRVPLVIRPEVTTNGAVPLAAARRQRPRPFL